MTPLILLLGLWLGGEGFVEYSVKLSVFKLGVLGLLSVPSPFAMPLPLTTTPFSIISCSCVSQIQLREMGGVGTGVEELKESRTRNSLVGSISLFTGATSERHQLALTGELFRVLVPRIKVQP
jgi:hypothetical protein